MKKIFVLLTLICSSLTFAQKVDTLFLGFNKTVLLVFDQNVKRYRRYKVKQSI